MVDKKEELRMIKLLYQIVMDKTVQRRFATAMTCNMRDGSLSEKRLIDQCEDFLKQKAQELVNELEKEV